MGWARLGPPALLLDLLSLAALKKSAVSAPPSPSPQGESPQACTGWFIYKYTDVSSLWLSFPFSAFVGGAEGESGGQGGGGDVVNANK